MYICFKTFFYVVRHLDSIASYLPIGFHLGFFRSWPSLYPPSSFSSVFLVLSFVRVTKSKRMRWTGHVARIGERRVVYKVLVEGRPLGRFRRRWEYNIKMDLQEVGCGVMDWIELA